MSYVKGKDIFPEELLQAIQAYVDGEYVYIPRRDENKRAWGEQTDSKQETRRRNGQIYQDYLAGAGVSALSERYFLSQKSIRRILLQQRRGGGTE